MIAVKNFHGRAPSEQLQSDCQNDHRQCTSEVDAHLPLKRTFRTCGACECVAEVTRANTNSSLPAFVNTLQCHPVEHLCYAVANHAINAVSYRRGKGEKMKPFYIKLAGCLAVISGMALQAAQTPAPGAGRGQGGGGRGAANAAAIAAATPNAGTLG